MKVTTKISKDQLTTLLKDVSRGQFVNIETTTIVKMNKKGNPYYNQVFKTSNKNVRCLPDYEKRVQKKTDNPDFVSRPNWFTHETDCVVSKNSDTTQKYFMYETFEKVSVRNSYIHNGQEINKEVFSPYLPTYQERDIQVFTINIDNIKKVSLNGQRYEVR
jgi:hypothetical protein